jgi:hypothetical protein
MSGCIFCGASPSTNAHIFRRAWMEEVFPGTEMFHHRHVRRHTEGFDKEWDKDEADLKVNCACESCNGGWMNRLDLEAEAIFLDHAVRGFSVRVDRHNDKKLLARWCLLVAVLFDQAQETPVLGTDAHEALCQGDLPDGVLIWLLRTEPPQWRVTAWAEPRGLQFNDPSAEVAHAYFVTFGVNQLVAQLFVPTERTPEGIEFNRSDNAPVLRQLWPAPLTPFIWPPPRTVGWEQMDELANTLVRPRPE